MWEASAPGIFALRRVTAQCKDYSALGGPLRPKEVSNDVEIRCFTWRQPLKKRIVDKPTDPANRPKTFLGPPGPKSTILKSLLLQVLVRSTRLLRAGHQGVLQRAGLGTRVRAGQLCSS